MERLPAFSWDDYAALLRGLGAAGYGFETLTGSAAPGTCWLRHDLDLHLEVLDQVSALEADLGVVATYYILVTGPYNPASAVNRARLRRLVERGHEVGLHYDLSLYPQEVGAAARQLTREAAWLESLSGTRVRTITTHNPYQGLPDPFLDQPEFFHPHGVWQQGVTYLSDSCRAWRDENLLRCLGPSAPPRLMLNTHPEVWEDGTVTDRVAYLEVVRAAQARGYAAYLDEVRGIWTTHAAPRQHDERVRSAAAAATE